jgi:hypothetical protein
LPLTQTVGTGNEALFTVQAAGSQPLSYQWSFNGANLPGATGSSLLLPDVQPTNAGAYAVTITNAVGAQVSPPAYLSVVPTPPCVTAPTGLVSWWQGEGNAVDAWGTNSGVLEGGVTFGAGEVRQAFELNGASAYISIPASTTLNVGTNSGLTLEGWINPADLDERPIAEFNSGGNLGVHFWQSQPAPAGNGTGCLFANLRDIYGEDHWLPSAAGLLQAGVYQHVALTYDYHSGLGTIYLNGQIAAEIGFGSLVPQTSYPLCLGARPAGTPVTYFNGLLDEFSLYSRALTPNEVLAIYNAGGGGKCAPPPTLVTQPASQRVAAGSTALFSAQAKGGQPLAYQWQFNGTNLPGATNTVLVLPDVQPAAAGPYSVTVSNPVGTQASSNAVLTVYVPVCTPAPAGLVGWWQGEGNTLDALGLNPGFAQGPLAYGPGKVGQAFVFDGLSSYVFVPPLAAPNTATNTGLTIEGWICPADLAERPLAEFNTNGTFGAHFWQSQATPYGTGTGCLYANLIDTSGLNHWVTTPAGILVSNLFQHVALTYDQPSGVCRIYYNGAPVLVTNLASFTPQTSYPLCLGARPVGTPVTRFYGLMDEMSVYDRALTPAEVQAIFGADSAGKCGLAPAFLVQPTSQTVTLSNSVLFRAAVSGSQPLSFCWLCNGTNLPGATNAILVLDSVQAIQAGAYSVVASNAFGTATSSNAILAVSAPVCAPFPYGLVSWWPFEGNVLDECGTNNGTVMGTVTYAPGKVGQALSLNGANGAVSVHASGTSNVGTNSGFSVDFWVNPTDLQPRPLLEWNTGLGPQTFLWSSMSVTNGGGGPGCLCADLHDSSGRDHILTTPAGLLATGTFQHVALTYSQTTSNAVLYLNGTVVAQGLLGSFVPLTTANLYLGVRVAGAGSPAYFSGLLDEVDLFSRALSAAEVQALCNAGSAGRCLSPWIYLQPQATSVTANHNATFSVTAVGYHPLAYQWQYEGVNLAGATNSTLTLSNVQPSSAGAYSVLVTNGYGSALSSNANLSVNVALIYANGQLLTNAQYTFGGSVTLELTNAYANGDLFYTLDGTQPTFASSMYTGPLVITNSCTIWVLGYSPDFTQSGDSQPVVIQILPVYTVQAITAGGGTIFLNPTNGPYISNSIVTVAAVPAPGWVFQSWLGNLSGTSATNYLVMDTNRSVQAVFATTLATTAVGGGSVLLDPPGGLYAYGATVEITAVPQSGTYFALWGNAASGNANPLLFVVTNAKPTVSALFGQLSAADATLTVVPVGHGSVALAPAANFYSLGQIVTVTATPASGSSFLGWSGDATGTQNPLGITVDRSRTVYANFSLQPTFTGQVAPGGLSAGFELLLTCQFGAVYRLDGSSDLLNWSPLVTVTCTNALAPIVFTDYYATNFPQRFYRAVAQ